MDSNDNVMYRRSSSSSLPSPSSDYSSSSLGSAYDRKSTGDAGWSDPVTPLKATKDNSASLLIDSGYAGEQPGGGGDRSIPFSKYKFSSRVDERQGSYEAPWTVHLETDGISLVFGFLTKRGCFPGWSPRWCWPASASRSSTLTERRACTAAAVILTGSMRRSSLELNSW